MPVPSEREAPLKPALIAILALTWLCLGHLFVPGLVGQAATADVGGAGIWFPEPRALSDGLRFRPSGSEVRSYLLDLEAFPSGVTISGRLAADRDTRLAWVFGPELDSSLGTIVEVAVTDPPVLRVLRRETAGEQVLAEKSLPPRKEGEPIRLRVAFTTRSVQVEYAGVDVLGSVRVPGSAADRRLHFELRFGEVDASDLKIESPTPFVGGLKVDQRAAVKWPARLRRKEWSWAGPLDQVGEAGLTQGLPAHVCRDVLALRTPPEHGTPSGPAERASALADQWPEARGASFLAGARWLFDLAEPRPALRYLDRAQALPQSCALRGDAYWLGGRLALARAEYEKAPEGVRDSGLALVAWAEGRTADALALAAAAPTRKCRLADLRLHLLRLVASLVPAEAASERLVDWPDLSVRGQGRVRILSDRGPAAASALLEDAQSFLAHLDAIFPTAKALPEVLVLACARRPLYNEWNEALGGTRFEETTAVYRPGFRLILLTDDGDRAVVRHRLRHELVHHAVHGAGLFLPPVFEEGLCEWVAWSAPGSSIQGFRPSLPLGRRSAARRLSDSRDSKTTDLLLSEVGRDGWLGEEDYVLAWAAADLLATAKESPTRSVLTAFFAAASADDLPAMRRLLDTHAPAGLLRERLKTALR